MEIRLDREDLTPYLSNQNSPEIQKNKLMQSLIQQSTYLRFNNQNSKALILEILCSRLLNSRKLYYQQDNKHKKIENITALLLLLSNSSEMSPKSCGE